MRFSTVIWPGADQRLPREAGDRPYRPQPVDPVTLAVRLMAPAEMGSASVNNSLTAQSASFPCRCKEGDIAPWTICQLGVCGSSRPPSGSVQGSRCCWSGRLRGCFTVCCGPARKEAPPSVGQARGELAETRRLSRNPTAATLARVSLLTGSGRCPSRSQFKGQSS